MKVCNICGANNDDAAVKCSVCGEIFATNGFVTGDEATTLIEPMDAGLANNSQMNANMQPGFQSQDMGMGGQPQFGQPNMGMNGQPQFGQQDMGMGGQPQFGQQDMGMGGMPQFSQGAPAYSPLAQPPAANKGKLFIILGAIALVVVVAVALILLLGGNGKGGAKSPEEAAKIYLEGMEDGDIDKIMSVAPPFATKEDREMIEEALGMLSGFKIKIEYIGLVDKTEMDVEDEEAEIKSDYGKTIELEEVIEAELEYEVSMTVFGETTSEVTSEYMTFLKYKGKWYIGY